jgi:hypothetical protein
VIISDGGLRGSGKNNGTVAEMCEEAFHLPPPPRPPAPARSESHMSRGHVDRPVAASAK